MEQNTKKAQEIIDELMPENLTDKVSLFLHYTELAQKYAESLMANEVEAKTGKKYTREHGENDLFDRWGSNPGSLRVGDERVRITVPRMLNKQTNKTESPEIYGQLRSIRAPEERLLKSIILGLSQQNYGRVNKQLLESFGMSQSQISREFMKHSRKVLEAFEKRKFTNYNFIALVIDGKYLRREQVIIALGITREGMKIPLGFVHSTTENAKVVKEFLQSLVTRDFKYDDGLLVITDGSKGIISAVESIFGYRAVRQRCQWHKRENVVSYLPDSEQQKYLIKLQHAYCRPTYEEAKEELLKIHKELLPMNRSAAASLEEGLEETLTIHRLGLYEELGVSLCTTNVIENVNSQLERYLGKVRYWHNSEMRARWIACALVHAEGKMRRINNHKRLHLLQIALLKEIKITENKAS